MWGVGSMDYVVEAGKVYYFLKDNVWVKAVKVINDNFWLVQRLKDGKNLLAPVWALVEEDVVAIELIEGDGYGTRENPERDTG